MINLFESTGNIQNDIERFKVYLQDEFKGYKAITTKNHEKMYLVHGSECANEKSIYNGKIYVLSENGIIGLLHYEIAKYDRIMNVKDIKYISPEYYGLGIGTSIIKYLVKFALQEKISLIKGKLEPYDIENKKSQLIDFYSKYDFNLDFYNREVKKIIF